LTIQAILFRQSGGFAGLVRGCEVTLEEIGSIDRRALDWLATAHAATPTLNPGTRDQIVYELRVTTDAGLRQFEFDEFSVPEDLADLVERLVKQSHPIPL
jgi:hypothetical protein